MKLKLGDTAKVIKKLHGHKFKLGTIVTITDVTDVDYKCSADGDYWYLKDEELKKVKTQIA